MAPHVYAKLRAPRRAGLSSMALAHHGRTFSILDQCAMPGIPAQSQEEVAPVLVVIEVGRFLDSALTVPFSRNRVGSQIISEGDAFLFRSSFEIFLALGLAPKSDRLGGRAGGGILHRARPARIALACRLQSGTDCRTRTPAESPAQVLPPSRLSHPERMFERLTCGVTGHLAG